MRRAFGRINGYERYYSTALRLFHSRPLNTFFGCLAITIWSTAFGVSRTIAENLGFFGTALRYLIGGALGMAIEYKKLRLIRALPRSYLVICGGIYVFNTSVTNLAVVLSSNRQQTVLITVINCPGSQWRFP